MSANLWKVYDLEGNMHELSELNSKEMVRHMKWTLDNPKAKAPEVEAKEAAPKVEEAVVKEVVKEPVVEDKAPEPKEEEAPEAKKEEAPVAEDKPKRGRPSKK